MLMSLDENDPLAKTIVSAFTQALADLGWTDGRNVRVDLRWTGDDINQIRALAQELVGSQPDIIVTNAIPPTVAVQRETRTILIVFANAAEPVASGIVAGRNQPGGNITGFAILEASLGGKWLELLSEIAPVHGDAEIETAVIALGRDPRGGLVVMTDVFMVTHRAAIISAAARNNVPAGLCAI
jgi:putative ABC transport system substrate-binding protein